MEQRHEFELSSRSRLELLLNLLVDTTTELGITFNGSGARSGIRRVHNKTVPPMDFGAYDIIHQNQTIGRYEWTLKPDKNLYDITLDLSRLSPEHYEAIARILAPKFPEARFPAYAK